MNIDINKDYKNPPSEFISKMKYFLDKLFGENYLFGFDILDITNEEISVHCYFYKDFNITFPLKVLESDEVFEQFIKDYRQQKFEKEKQDALKEENELIQRELEELKRLKEKYEK